MKVLIAMLVALVLPLQLVAALPAQAAGSITFTPATGGPGQTVEVQGAGFAAGTFTVSEPFPTPQSQTVTVGSNGNLVSFFTVPAGTPASTYIVSVSDASSAVVASGTFNVTTGPALTLSPAANVKPSTSVNVSGSAFSTALQVTLQLLYTNTSGQTQTEDVGPISVANGAFSTSVAIPSNARSGGFTINAYPAASATGSVVATASGTIAAPTAITLSPSTGPAGTTTSDTVAGTGFGSNETVTINYTATLTTSNVGTGNTLPVSTSVETNTAGAFSTTISVPSNIVPGTYNITATGTTSGLQAKAALTITPKPAISLNPTATAPGTLVVVTGQLFAPNLGVTVSATIPTSGGNVNLSGQTSTDAAGAFTSQLFVPTNAVGGDVKVTATELQAPGGASSATATLTIRGVQGTITASPLSAVPGTIITISGSGFATGPNAPVTVTASIPVVGGGSQLVSTTADTNSNGVFTGAELLIPANAAPGGITLSASQPTSGATATTVIAIVAPSPTPTATPTPSPTATSTPTATPKPTSTPTTTPVAGLHFQRLSVRYHVVHVGTFNHIDVQASLRAKVGIWVHVLFPSGRHWDYFQHTNGQGHWARSFNVPYNATSRFTNIAHIELQLWKGKSTVKDFMPFTIIP